VLGANPAEYLIRATGDWTLRFICIVLAVTPLRVMSKWNAAGALSPHAGPVRVLLRGAAPAVLQLVRHGLRVGRHRQGHRQAAVHPGGLLGLRAADAAGRHLVQPRDQGDGCEALADAAQAGLRDRGAGHPALLLDARGQEQLRRSVRLRAIIGVLLGGGYGSFAKRKRKAKPALAARSSEKPLRAG
jgi:sulfoxide reductase heme-binding subunit YedZ